MITYMSSAKAAESIAGEINSQGSDVSGYAIQADSSKAMEAALRIVAECRKRFPEGIDIIVNNAADGSDVNLADLAVDNFDRIFHTNVLFPMLLLQQARLQLRKKARIVNISSISARRSNCISQNGRCATLTAKNDGQGFPSAITYAASKAALESITRSLAKELGNSKYSRRPIYSSNESQVESSTARSMLLILVR